MGIKEALGLGGGTKVRYAVAGAGDIAQEDMLPGVAHTGNSELTAIITGDPEKARVLGEKYDVAATFSYAQYAEALASGTFDAVYIATPNWKHAELVLPALRAGIHVLCEKPLEVTRALCEQIALATTESRAKLMVAYRLHFEPATLATIDLIRSGKLGKVHTFVSTFAQPLDPANHRAHNGELAGPVLDMGTYPVNAARYVFEDEPVQVVSAVGSKHPESGFAQDFADTVAVTLRFPGDRFAQFSVSYYGGPLNTWVAVGPQGSVTLDPGYTFGKKLEQTVAIGQDKKTTAFANTDHFGGEMKYFSDCILRGLDPEPDAEEGLADVRVLEGILEALRTGRSVDLPPFTRSRRIDTTAQKVELRAVTAPDPVNAASPAAGAPPHGKN
jgi:predicted dehydrogenase